MSFAIDGLPTFMLAKIPAEVKFKRTGILTDVGGYAYLHLVFNDADTPAIDGDTLVFNLGTGEQLIFTYNTTVTDSPLSMPLPTGSFEDDMTVLSQHLYRHPTIRQNYSINIVGYDAGSGNLVIEIKSKKRGTDYNIDVDAATTVTYSNTDTFVYTIATDDTVLEDYKLKVTATTSRDALYNYEEISVEDIEVTGVMDTDNNEVKLTLYDLPEIGRSVLKPDIPYNAYLPLPQRNNVANIRLELNEQYNGADKKSFISRFTDLGQMDLVDIMILNGGLPLNLFPTVDTFSSWFKFAQNGQRFFTYASRNKLVTTEQPEWLTFLAYIPGLTTVTFTVYYTDGSTDTKDVTFTNYVSQWMIPTGYKQNGLGDLQPLKTAAYYTIKLTQSFGIYSELFTYVIDTRYYAYQRYFIFTNSLGYIETLRCCGVNSFSVKKSGETTGLAIDSNSRVDKGSIEMVYNEVEQLFTMRTGYLLNKQEKEWLTDLLLSTYVAEVPMPMVEPFEGTYYKQRYISCIVLPDTIEMWDDDTGLYAMEWKMKYAHNETSYSILPVYNEIWYDTTIEFTIDVTAISGGTNNVEIIMAGTDSLSVTVNGREQSTTVDITKTGTYHFIVRCTGSDTFSMQFNGVTAELTLNVIDTKSIANFWLFYVEAIKGELFYKRMANFNCLVELVIWMNHDDAAKLDLDRLLAALSYNHKNWFGLLTDIDIPFNTPGTSGTIIKNYLTSEGLTVSTA